MLTKMTKPVDGIGEDILGYAADAGNGQSIDYGDAHAHEYE
jgi:hypothetical protein